MPNRTEKSPQGLTQAKKYSQLWKTASRMRKVLFSQEEHANLLFSAECSAKKNTNKYNSIWTGWSIVRNLYEYADMYTLTIIFKKEELEGGLRAVVLHLLNA